MSGSCFYACGSGYLLRGGGALSKRMHAETAPPVEPSVCMRQVGSYHYDNLSSGQIGRRMFL